MLFLKALEEHNLKNGLSIIAQQMSWQDTKEFIIFETKSS